MTKLQRDLARNPDLEKYVTPLMRVALPKREDKVLSAAGHFELIEKDLYISSPQELKEQRDAAQKRVKKLKSVRQKIEKAFGEEVKELPDLAALKSDVEKLIAKVRNKGRTPAGKINAMADRFVRVWTPITGRTLENTKEMQNVFSEIYPEANKVQSRLKQAIKRFRTGKNAS